MLMSNVGAHLAKRALLNPGLEALVDVSTGRRFTYAELDRRADQAARALTDQGLVAGDRVAVLLPNSSEFAEVFYGAAKAGLVVVALNWRLVADELAFMLDDSGATVLVSSAEHAAVVADLQARAGKEATPVTSWVHVGPDAPAWALPYEDLVGAADGAPVEPVVGDDAPLFIMYTSGTTGLPKGALHTHETVEQSVLTVMATADLRFKDRYLISLPLYHVGALNPLTCTIYRGGTVVLMRQFDPTQIWDLFRDERITGSLAVPAMLHVMLQTYDAGAHGDLSLRWVMSGAAPVPTSLIEAYAGLGLEIHQVYGLTETGGPACLISPDDALDHIGSTGKAFFHTDVRIVDPEGADVAPGVPGEVLVRGRHVMAGYWNRPEATAEAIRDGWLHTGDIAVVDEDGFVFIRDRIKDMIISGGENIYPAEIEDVLIAHPGVADAAVIGMPSARWGESPLAVVVRADPELDEATVLKHCDGRLARYKLPRQVLFTDAIPRNPTGKALKRMLREQFPVTAPD